MQLRANKDVEGLARGEHGRIVNVDRVHNLVSFKNERTGELTTVRASELNSSKYAAFEEQQREFGQNDRVMFLENNSKLGVKNGQAGTLQSVDERGNMVVSMDNGREVKFNCSQDKKLEKGMDAKYHYDKVSHAYAGTVEKSQGGTWDKGTVIDPNSFNDLNTAVTRFRQDCHIVTPSLEQTKDMCALPQTKTSNLDYSQNQTRNFLHPTDLKYAQKSGESEKSKPTEPETAKTEKPTEPELSKAEKSEPELSEKSSPETEKSGEPVSEKSGESEPDKTLADGAGMAGAELLARKGEALIEKTQIVIEQGVKSEAQAIKSDGKETLEKIGAEAVTSTGLDHVLGVTPEKIAQGMREEINTGLEDVHAGPGGDPETPAKEGEEPELSEKSEEPELAEDGSRSDEFEKVEERENAKSEEDEFVKSEESKEPVSEKSGKDDVEESKEPEHEKDETEAKESEEPEPVQEPEL